MGGSGTGTDRPIKGQSKPIVESIYHHYYSVGLSILFYFSICESPRSSFLLLIATLFMLLPHIVLLQL